MTKTKKRRRDDLTGRKFGRLTVLYRNGEYVHAHGTVPYWLCQCECGVQKLVLANALRSGRTLSCGCLHREVCSKVTDLTGRRYGRLTVLGFAGKHGKGQFIHWRCLCDCGLEKIVRGTSLTNGHTTSCGCLWKERTRKACTKHGKSRTREYLAMKARERLERKRKLDVHWTFEMEQALRRLQPCCVVCNAEADLTVDHVLPLSKGHGLYPGNAVVLCGSCNSQKHAKPLNRLGQETANKITTAAADFAVAWADKP